MKKLIGLIINRGDIGTLGSKRLFCSAKLMDEDSYLGICLYRPMYFIAMQPGAIQGKPGTTI